MFLELVQYFKFCILFVASFHDELFVAATAWTAAHSATAKWKHSSFAAPKEADHLVPFQVLRCMIHILCFIVLSLDGPRL